MVQLFCHQFFYRESFRIWKQNKKGPGQNMSKINDKSYNIIYWNVYNDMVEMGATLIDGTSLIS